MLGREEDDIRPASVESTEIHDFMSIKTKSVKGKCLNLQEDSLRIKVESKKNYQAAIKLQKAYRGYKTRSQVMFVPVTEVQKMIKDLETKEKGFGSLIHMIFFLVVYFTAIVMQRNLLLSSSVQASLMGVTDGYNDVVTISDAFEYLRVLVHDLYDGNQEESVCNTCEMVASALEPGWGVNPLEACAYCHPDWEDEDCLNYCSIFVDCYGDPCESFQQVQNSSISKFEGTSNATFCAEDDFVWKAGMTKMVAGLFQHLEMPIEGRGWLGSKNRVFGGALLTFNFFQGEGCQDPLDSGLDLFYEQCSSDERRKSNIYLNGTPAYETFETFFYDSVLPYNEDIESFVWLIDIGLFNAGLMYEMCTFHAFEATSLFHTNTESIGIIIPVYNGQKGGLFTLIKLTFSFDHGGRVSASRFMKTFPIRNMYSSSSTDKLRIVCEILAICCMIVNIRSIVLQVYHRFKAARQRELETKKPTVENLLRRKVPQDSIVWLIAQISYEISVLAQVYYWKKLYSSMMSSNLTLPTDMQTEGLERLVEVVAKLSVHSRILSIYDSLASITAFINVLLVFKALKFHKQVSIITDTLSLALIDLVHFLIIFLFVHLLFSAIMWVMVGSQIEEYRSLFSAFSTMLLVTFGSFDFDALRNVSTIATYVFFFFEFLVTLLLFNILLSIIIDAYENAKTAASVCEEPFFESLFNFLGRRYCRFCNVCHRGIRLFRKRKTVPEGITPRILSYDDSEAQIIQKYAGVKSILTHGFNYKIHKQLRGNRRSSTQDLIDLKTAKKALMQSPCLHITAIRYLRRRSTILNYKE